MKISELFDKLAGVEFEVVPEAVFVIPVDREALKDDEVWEAFLKYSEFVARYLMIVYADLIDNPSAPLTVVFPKAGTSDNLQMSKRIEAAIASKKKAKEKTVPIPKLDASWYTEKKKKIGS